MSETNITEKTNNQPRWFTIFRIALGLVLLFKGISFIRDRTGLKTMIEQSGMGAFSHNLNVWAFLVAFINLLGGLFIACGLFTRTSCIIQIPILVIAFFINIRGADSFELILSVLVLILLVFFAVKGSGALSADEYFRSYYKAGNEDGHAGKIFNK